MHKIFWKFFKQIIFGIQPFYGGDPAPAPSPPAATTQTSISTPWEPAGQALYNANATYNPATGRYDNIGTGPTGAYQSVQNFAQDYGTLNNAQRVAIKNHAAALTGQNNALNNLTTNNVNAAQQLANGKYDTHYNPIGNAETAYSNGLKALQDSGTEQANRQLLTGLPNMEVLKQMQDANINAANRQYQQNVVDLQTKVLPGINNDAFAAGQYGSSRQGIAQGLALNGLINSNEQLARANLDAGNTMYGNAYNTSQGLMSNAANNLLNNSLQNSQFNATAGNNQNQFNANLGITNNNQQMAQQLQNNQNMQAGYVQQQNALNNQATDANANFNAQWNLLQMPQQQAQNALNLQLGAYGAGAGYGGNSSSSMVQPIYNNTLGQTAGLLTAGAGVVSAFK